MLDMNHRAASRALDRRGFTRSALGAALLGGLPLSQALGAGIAARLTEIVTDVEVATRAGGKTVVSRSALKEFQASLRGELLLAGSPGYDDARRVFNAMFDRRPALIARCWGAGDVKNAVDFARGNDLLVAVKAGGHSISGKSACEGGFTIDLAPMRGVRVDPAAKRARAQGGALLGDLDSECQQFALATTAGTVSHTGVGGLTLGGGVGRLARRFGMTCDNVLSFDVITADGAFRRASADENPDLYWGLRGGGGNFGVVTSFEYRLHDLGPKVLAGQVAWPPAQARDLVDFYGAFSAAAPNELSVDLLTFARAGMPPTVTVTFCYSGDLAEGERVLAPLLAFGAPTRSRMAPIDYAALQRLGDSTYGSQQYYSGGGMLPELSQGAVDILLDRLDTLAGEIRGADRGMMIGFQLVGGAIAEPAPDAMAYPHRTTKYDFVLASAWTDPGDSEANVAHMRGLNAMMKPHTIGAYSNFQGDEDDLAALRAYRGNLERMVALKNRYDPANLFRLNTNVKPTV